MRENTFTTNTDNNLVKSFTELLTTPIERRTLEICYFNTNAKGIDKIYKMVYSERIMNMPPKANHDVIGRHGVIGQDILSHDLDLAHTPALPVEIGQDFAELVDDMDERVKAMIAAEMAQEAAERKEREARDKPALETRGAEIAVASEVSLSTSNAA